MLTKRRHATGWLMAGASFFAFAAPAVAQSTGPAADKDVVVIVGQTIEETLPQELEKYGSDVEVTDSLEIRESGFVDVAQALQMDTPGLFLAPRGGPFSYLDISLQGSRTQDMLFLVDGVRINNRLYSGTITDTLPASMVERIEVLKGGQSLYYGTQAGAGVINVVTRGYTDEFDGMASIGGDTNDSIHVDGYVRGKLGPGNYVVYASQDKSNGIKTYSTVQPSATDQNRSYDVNNFGGKYRVKFGDTFSVDARYSHTDARLDYPGVRVTAFSKNERDEDIASLGLEWNATDDLDFLVKGYWHDWDSQYTTINNRIPLGTGQTVIDNQTYWGYEDKGINALAKYRGLKGFELVGGYDYQVYSGVDDVLLIAEQEEDVNAVFVQARTTDDLVENLALAVGARYNKTGSESATVWNASARYDILPTLYVQGIVGTSFMLPTAEQLYAIDPFSTLGSSGIKPEESESLNLSVGGQYDNLAGGDIGLSWQATWFARDIDNLIGFADFASLADFAARYPGLQVDPDPSTPGNEYFENGYYTNVAGSVEVRGYELLGAMTVGDNWAFNASWTHTDSEQVSATGATSTIQRIPVDFAKAGASWRATSGRFGINSHLLWVGEQRANVTGFGSVNHGDYTVLDIGGFFYIDADQHHKLSARLQNALDEDYWTRPGSALVDGSTTTRFLYGNNGVPQTFSLTYSYDF